MFKSISSIFFLSNRNLGAAEAMPVRQAGFLVTFFKKSDIEKRNKNLNLDFIVNPKKLLWNTKK